MIPQKSKLFNGEKRKEEEEAAPHLPLFVIAHKKLHTFDGVCNHKKESQSSRVTHHITQPFGAKF